MGSYKIRSEPLGIEINFDSDRDVTEEDVFSLLKGYVPPQKMLDAYVSKGDEGQKLALQAFQHGFFEEEGEGPGLWSVIGDAASMMTSGGYKATIGGNQTTTWLRQLNQAMGQPPAKREYADWEQEGIEKAANVFRGNVGTIGTSAVFQGIPILFGAKPKDIPLKTALENAFKTAGLPLDDRGLIQKVVSESVKLDDIQRRATRYQGTAEAMTGLGLIGAVGKEYVKRAALDKWRGPLSPAETERLDELDARAQLDYLVDQYDIMEKMEKGAQTVAQSGGSFAYMGKFINPKFQPFEPDLETYSAIVQGTVKPDPDEAFFFGMVSSPDVAIAPLISSGVKIPYRMVTSSAIKKQAASVLNHRKAVHHFKEQIRRAEAAGITGPGYWTDLKTNARNLLPVAENNLTAATAKFEKLVGRSVPAAQKVVGADAAQMAALQATARGSKEVIDGLKKLENLTPVQTKILATEESKFALAETRLKALHAKAGPLRQAVSEAIPDPKAPIITKALGKTLQGAGISVEYVGRMVEYLHRFTEEQIATLAQKTMRISGDEALKMAKVIKRPIATLAVLGASTEWANEAPGLGDFITLLLTSQKGAQIVARMGSDINLIGKQYAYARNTIPGLARFSQLPDEDRAFTDIVLDRTDDLTFGETASDLTRILNRKTRQFQPGPISRGIAQGMTRTGMAQSIDALGRGVRGTAEAVAMPAGIGYAAGGEEGAAMAVGASLPLIVGGFGFGALARYAPAELTAKQMADLQYYKKELLPIEEAEQFGKLPKALQIAVSSLSNEHPDVMFSFDDTKPSHWRLVGGESKININRKDGRASMPLLAHEVGHHIDWHGATPQVLEAILGSYEKGKEGYYTIRITDNMSKKRLAQIRKHLRDEYRHHGEILTDDNGIVIVKDAAGNSSYAHNEAFAKHRIEYLEALDKDPLISDKAKKEYRNSPERIARELFADHVADDIVTGGNVARNHRGVGSRLMIALGRTLVHNNVVRKLMHKMGIPSLDSGKIVGNRVFNELDKIPALQRIIEKYNKDVLGASRESRRSGKGRRVVDPEHPDEYADMVFTMEELKDPNNLQKLKDAGVLETDPKTGAIVTNPFGEPIFLPTREIKARNRQLASEVIEAIKSKTARGDVMPEGHLTVERAVDGKEYATGRYLSEDIINKLADSGKYSQGQIQMLRDMNKALRDQDGDAFDLFYYAALGWQRGRKVYKSIKGGNRRSLPFGIRISKDGNILIETVSYDKVIENLNWFAEHRKGGMGNAFHQSSAKENVKVAEKLLPRFLRNHMDGIENGTEGSAITNEQAYLLNASLGPINTAQIGKNPRLEGLGNKKSQRMASYRSRRLDRIGDSARVEADMPINPSAIMEGKMPAADDPSFMPRAADDETVPLPFIEDLGGEAPEAGFKRVWTEKMGKKELEAWEGLETTPSDVAGSQAGPFIPRFGKDEGRQFMPAEDAGAPKGKEAEAARLWQEKGTDSPFFKKWSKNAPIVKLGETPEFVPDSPVVVEGLHGTTHSFETIDPMRSNPENDFGQGFYLSNSHDDVAMNYALETGPDLANRIELRSERLFDQMLDDPAAFNLKENLSEQAIQDKARQMAVAELSGGEPQTYRVYARMDKPLVVGGRFKKESKFTYEFNEKTGEETGTLIDLIEAIREEAAGEYFQVDADRLVSDILDVSYDEIGAYDLVNAMKESEGLMYAENDMGNLVSSDFIKNVFREMGYDGIIDLTVDVKFGSKRQMGQKMEGVTSDTIHYVAFEPTQIKSATGNRGTFDPASSDISYMPAMNLADDFIADVVAPLKNTQRSQILQSIDRALGRSFAKDIGLIDFLDGKKSVSKAELETFIRENTPELEVEVTAADFPHRAYEEWQALIDEAEGRQDRDAVERLTRQSEADEGLGGARDVQHSKYQELGGTNYREIVVRLKRKKGEEVFHDDAHFGPDVLLWLRMNERIDPDGKRVYFIEEIQSKWHQKGRKEGYGRELPLELIESASKIESLNDAARMIQDEIGVESGDVAGIFFSEKDVEQWGSRSQEYRARRLREYVEREFTEVPAFGQVGGGVKGVPDAPFKDTWPALAMKYAIKDAMDRGFDRIAWLDGEGQNTRYDLRKVIQKIDVDTDLSTRGRVRVELIGKESWDFAHGPRFKSSGEVDLKTNRFVDGTFDGKRLGDVIGEALAKKILKRVDTGESSFTLTDPDLSILTKKGMKLFYDEQVVSLAKKLSKRIGGGKVKRETMWSHPEPDLGDKSFGSHGFDLPTDKQAAADLPLYMPAVEGIADTAVPEILLRRGAGRGMLPKVAGVEERSFMPAGDTGYALRLLRGEEVAEGLGNRPTVLEIARHFQDRFGRPINFRKASPEEIKFFEDSIFDEVIHARELHPEAAGWYDENLGLAMSILRELDPAITKPRNNFLFKAILAATSDGNEVQPQFSQAWNTYDHWKQTGEMSGEFVSGDRVHNIRNNLLRIEAIDKVLGAKAPEWLTRKGTVKEVQDAAVRDLGWTRKEANKIGSDELVDEVVPYAIILGPKLGSFFNNLYGDYSTLTMDRWFMRTVGRNLGTQVQKIPPSRMNPAKVRLREAVAGISAAERRAIGVTKAEVAGNKALQTAGKLSRFFSLKENRRNLTPQVNEVRLAANTLAKMQKPLRETPGSGGERRWIRERIANVQKRLRDEGIEIENADLQALLWYNEKEIYEKLGYRSPRGASDYAGAADSLHAKLRGRPSRSYSEGAGRVGRIGRGGRQPGVGQESPQKGLGPSKQFMPAGERGQPAPRLRVAPAPQGNRFMAPMSRSAGRAGASRADLDKFLSQ